MTGMDYSNIIDYAGLSFQWQILQDIKYIFIKTLLSFYRTEPERLAVLKADNSSVNNSDNLLIIRVIFFLCQTPPKIHLVLLPPQACHGLLTFDCKTNSF